MRTQNSSNGIDYRLFYVLVIGMIFAITAISNDAEGIGPICDTSHCKDWAYDGNDIWRCMGCERFGTCCDLTCVAGVCQPCNNDPCKFCCPDGPCCLVGQGCCNGSCYNDTNQVCCGGQVHPKGNCMECIFDTWVPKYCDPDRCETCVDNNCTSCGGDTTKCCDTPPVGPPVCLPRCIPEGGDMCTYTPPPAADPLCTFESPDWPYCQNPGASCAWVAVEGPYNNAICRLGCSCSLGSTYCVRLEPKQCKNMLFVLPPFVHCQCEAAEGLVEPVTRGTRSICSTP